MKKIKALAVRLSFQEAGLVRQEAILYARLTRAILENKSTTLLHAKINDCRARLVRLNEARGQFNLAVMAGIMNFESEYLGVPIPENPDLIGLAKKYHDKTESFDRTVCTGPIENGCIRPMTGYEASIINKNALKIREAIILEARESGISREAMMRAIRNSQ